MAKKQYFIIIDTETTITDKVFDFGAVVVDRAGNVVKSMACVVADFSGDELFYNPAETGFWGKDAATKRKAQYNQMVEAGSRVVASVGAINRWLEKANALYNPTLTAYNLAFDTSKCANSLIDLTIFQSRFCLWQAALGNICNTRAYREFVLNNHVFTNRTSFGNMSVRTNAETVAGFLAGTLTDEPHTALEDALYFEAPILAAITKKKKWQEKIVPFDWKKWQVKDHFSA